MKISLVFVVILVFLGSTSAKAVQPLQKVSPRQTILQVLSKAGCTNMLIARYVVDAYQSGISASVLSQRLNGIVPFTTKQLSTW